MKKVFSFIIFIVMGVLVIPNCVFADVLTIDVDTEEELRKVLEERKDLEGNAITSDDLVVNITKDIAISEKSKKANELESGKVAAMVITSDVTVLGNGHKIETSDIATVFAIYAPVQAKEQINVKINNVTISSGANNGRCIDTRTSYINLTLDGVTLKTKENSSNQTITIGSSGKSNLDVTIKNSTVEAGTAGYAVIVFNPINLTIDKSDLSGYGVLYMKKEASDSKINIKNKSTLTSTNVYDADTNSFGTIVFEDGGVNVEVVDSNLVSISTGVQPQVVIGDSSSLKPDGASIVTISGKSTIIADTLEEYFSISDSVVTVMNGVSTNYQLTSEFMPKGAKTVKNGDMYTVVEKHNVKLENVTNGKVSIANASYFVGETVSITATANEGYELATLKVVDANKKEIGVKDGKFVMPNSDVTVTVEFSKITHTADVPTVVVPEEEVEEPVIGVEKADEIEEILLDSLMEYGIVEDLNNSVTVALEVNTMEEEAIDEKVVEKMEEAAGKAKIATYFDITVAVRNSLDNSLVDTLPELTKEIELMILLPENLKNTNKDVERVYYVVRRHIDENNKETFELLEAKLSEDGNYLKFKTDKFSTYALAYEDVEAEEVLPPKTFDGIGTYFVIGALSLIALAGISIFAKKKLFN